ncbi:MAG: hypothetical protein QNJ32_24970 [Xenococcaceae cyanobacterium MO_167.B27]|nr:hypothetical protein [Xenococcaceae cyanobacterium MO_167.B27]
MMELIKLFGYGLAILVTVMFILSPYHLEHTQHKSRNPDEGMGSILLFFGKFLKYLALSALFIFLGLIVGILGYHWTADLSWLDSLVEASMILSGMGPVNPLSTASAKVFASLYALFSGLIFVIGMGIVLSPLIYSLLGQFSVSLKQETEEQGKQQQEKQEPEQSGWSESKGEKL